MLRGRWWVLVVLSVAGLVCGIWSRSGEEPRCRAECTVLVPGGPSGGGAWGAMDGPRSFTGFFYYLQTQIKLIRSKAVALRALELLEAGERGKLGDRPAEAIVSGLKVTRPEETLLLEISYTCEDGALAVAVANAVGQAFSEGGLERWRETASGLTRELGERLARLEGVVSEREGELDALKAAGGGADEAGLEISAKRAAEYRRQLVASELDRIGLEAQRELVAAHEGDVEGLLTVPAVAGDVQAGKIRGALKVAEARRASLDEDAAAEAKSELEAEARRLEAGLGEAVRQAVKALEERHSLAQEREGRVRALLAEAEGEMRAAGAAVTRQEKLVRELRTLREARENLERSRVRAELSSRARFSGVQMVEEATEAREIRSSGWQRGGLFGALLGLVLGLGLTAFLEAVDERVKSAEDVTEIVGGRLLGAIPRMEGASGRWERDLAAHLRPECIGAEAAKGLRAQLGPRLGEDCQVFLVTSAAPREGKSTVASLLAVTLAQGGRRTVLVDGDMRRGCLHRSFEVERGPGLSEYLEGEKGLHLVVRETAVSRLYLLPCGEETERPAELAGSEAFGGLLSRLRGRYDCVVIDGPPVLPVADALGMAGRCDGVLVVVQSERTLKRPLNRAVEMVRGCGGSILGAVANDVRPTSRYYYDYGYNRRAVGE